MPEVNPRRLTTNFEKLQWHAHRAEVTQAKIEEMERVAKIIGYGKQFGRMERADGSELPATYMGKKELETLHQYRRLIGIRDSHQAQISMYASLIGAGATTTQNPRVQTADGGYEFETE